ncbi:peptidoglycan D,D-transpeptidase FtsI family protein [Mesorhizobium sp. UC22_110]|uniref:peptidoglycan D,D-transpeptidase FtsI family protein n=1 Tax=unclassified Mesorhizobium TaxID=325217 RepID=UPI00366F85FE
MSGVWKGWLKRRFAAICAPSNPLVVEGRRGAPRRRVVFVAAGFLAVYAAMSGRLVHLGMQSLPESGGPAVRPTASRPDIIDRNGALLATDIKMSSLFAEPRRIVDADEVIERLSTVLADLDVEDTYAKLKSGKGFVWLRRQLTPRQQGDIMALGLPGIGFRTEKRRFYPGGPVASYIVGLTNLDNRGISGLEKYIDDQGLADLQQLGMATAASLAPVKLSVDLRVQHIVRDEALQAMTRFRAIAAGAVVINAKTGEVVAMASVPDFDPNNPVDAQSPDKLNRMSAGLYEMGSTIKSFTTAMALDSGKVDLNSTFDASRPLRIGRQIIRDFRGKGRVLTLPEVFLYSSNIGSAREADVVGIEGHREFLKRLGLLDRTRTQLPEVAQPTEPRVWKKVHSITAAFGHGFSTTPLQTAVGVVALMNGGRLMPPTFLPRGLQEALAVSEQVVKDKTSRDMRYIYKLNGEKGSGRSAAVPGYRVGGKTGTAEKVVNGRYSKDRNFNAFVAALPMDDPQFVILTIVDEPKRENSERAATAGFSAGPMAANIIRRAAPMLGVMPRFEVEAAAENISIE